MKLRYAFVAVGALLGLAGPASAQRMPSSAAGDAAFDQGNYPLALRLYTQDLKACEATRPSDDRCLSILRILSPTAALAGDIAQSEMFAQRALQLALRTLPERHLEVAGAYMAFAGALDVQGRHGEAAGLYKKALAIRQELLPASHRDIALAHHSLARSLDRQGKYAEAEPFLRRALELLEKLNPSGSVFVALLRDSLARNLTRQGRYAEAEPWFRSALVMYRSLLPPQHPDIVGSMLYLALNLEQQKRFAEAEPLLRDAARLVEQLPMSHPLRINCNWNLARYLQGHQGASGEILSIYRRARLGALERILTYSSPTLEAQHMLRNFRPIFLGSVSAAWAAAGVSQAKVGP